MKNKLLFILFFSGTLCIIIYNIYKESGIYYLALGEIPKDQYRYEYQDYVSDYLKEQGILKKYNKNFLREYYDTKLFQELITNSKTSIINGEKETITAAINNADIITISLGNNEIENIIKENVNKLNKEKIYKEIDDIFKRYEDILTKIRYLTTKPVIIIGYFNTIDSNNQNIDNVFEYAENKLIDFLEYKNTYLISLNEIFKNKKYTEKLNKIAPSIEGYKYIYKRIIEIYNLEIKA